ncbi:hypothetical protein SDC9_196308 [bioreactor metagenome]|uniref:Uncharacterized protein n=1 Tax=bioreactor metagenome TaxID=1076179 RepID=A0A645ICR4_9ZZZZ
MADQLTVPRIDYIGSNQHPDGISVVGTQRTRSHIRDIFHLAGEAVNLFHHGGADFTFAVQSLRHRGGTNPQPACHLGNRYVFGSTKHHPSSLKINQSTSITLLYYTSGFCFVKRQR